MQSLDNNCIVTSGADRGVRVWDLRLQGEPVITFEDVHFDSVNCIEVLQPKLFVTSSDDGLVNFWDIRTRKNIKSLDFPNQKVSQTKFLRKKHLVICHENELTILSASDNFSRR